MKKSKSALATIEPSSVEVVVESPQLEIEVLPSKLEFYKNLGGDTSQYLQDQSRSIKGLCRDINSKFEQIGDILIDIKKRVGHGNFGLFIKLELQPLYGIAEQTAEDLMRKSQFVKQFPTLNKFAPSVLTELSRVSTPETLIQEALRLADAGEKLTVAEVKKQKKETAPKPKFVKGNFVEFLDGTQQVIGQIEATSNKEGFNYKIKKLHGPSYKTKFPEDKLTLCPVQYRQNHFDDAYRQPKPGTQVILHPIGSYNQHLTGKTFTVVASIMDGVYVKSSEDNQTRLLVHWAELIPSEINPLEQQPPNQQELNGQLTIFPDTSDEPPDPDDFETTEQYENAHQEWAEKYPELAKAIDKRNSAVIDIKAETVSDIEPLLTFKDLERASDDQLSDLLSKVSLEIQQRIDTSVKAQLDALFEEFWEEIKDFDQRKKEQLLVLLIDKSFG